MWLLLNEIPIVVYISDWELNQLSINFCKCKNLDEKQQLLEGCSSLNKVDM